MDPPPLDKWVITNIRAILERDNWRSTQLEAAGVAAASIDRIRHRSRHNMTLAVLAKWAKALKTPAWALLHPQYDAADPFVVMTETQVEAEIAERVRQKLEPFADIIGALYDAKGGPYRSITSKPRPDLPPAAAESPRAPAKGKRR